MQLQFNSNISLSDLTDDEKELFRIFMQNVNNRLLNVCEKQINSEILREYNFLPSYSLHGSWNILSYAWFVMDYYNKMKEIEPDPEIVPDYGPTIIVEVINKGNKESCNKLQCNIVITLFNRVLINEFFYINFASNEEMDSRIEGYLNRTVEIVANSAQDIIKDANQEWNIVS